MNLQSLSFKPPAPRHRESGLFERHRKIQEGIKGAWNRFDDRFLKPHFGGEHASSAPRIERQASKEHNSMNFNSDHTSSSGNEYEMGRLNGNGNRNENGFHGKYRENDRDDEMVSLTSRTSR
jgi:hypothetical protein